MSEKILFYGQLVNPFVYEVLYYVYVHVHWDFVC